MNDKNIQVTDFYEDLEEGRKTELLVSQFLVNTGWGKLVEDLSGAVKDTLKGDFIFNYIYYDAYVEIKSDRQIHKWGNFFIEMTIERKTGKYDGWFKKADYEFLFFYDKCTCILYEIEYSALKKYVSQNMDKLECRRTPKYDEKGFLYCIIGKLLPVQTAITEGFVTIYNVPVKYNNFYTENF